MTKILLVRTSSMGDLIHTFPAVSEFAQHFPRAKLDWLAEESFVEIARLHPFVNNVVPCALRRWRKSPTLSTWREFNALQHRLRAACYDVVIDAQGLLKSVFLASRARGHAFVGFDRHSIREPMAAFFYDKTYEVSLHIGAIARYRTLFAKTFGYDVQGAPDFGLTGHYPRPNWLPFADRYWVALVPTARAAKEWPLDHWIALEQAQAKNGAICVLTWGNEKEKLRAESLAKSMSRAWVAPKMSLWMAAHLMANAEYVVGVDTGLLHLGNAFGRPVLAIFTDSLPSHAGVIGDHAQNLGGIGEIPSVEVALEALERLGV